MTTEQLLTEILTRLTSIEEKIEFNANPANHLVVVEKTAILKKALATGDRKKIKAATRFINGGK